MCIFRYTDLDLRSKPVVDGNINITIIPNHFWFYINKKHYKMSQRVFKSIHWYYMSWTYWTWTLKKTKKACWEEMKQNYQYLWHDSPAQDTPRIISETYNSLKSFFDTYLIEDRKVEIYVTNETSEDFYSAIVEIRIRNTVWSTIASTNNFMGYRLRKRLTMEFFDDIKWIDEDYDKFYPIQYDEIYKCKNQWFNIDEIKSKNKEQTTEETEDITLPF